MERLVKKKIVKPDFINLGQETVARKIMEAEGKKVTAANLTNMLKRIKKPIGVKYAR